MNWLKIGFMDFGNLIFLLLLIIFFVTFLWDFKITSKRSWVLLLTVMGLIGLVIFRAWKRKKLLEEFERREKELKELEKKYKDLLEKAQLTQEAYDKAVAELQRAKIEAGLALMRLDEKLAKKVEEIEREYQNLTVEESIARIKAALRSP